MTADPKLPKANSPAAPSASDLAEQIAEASRRQELADPDRALSMVDRVVNRTIEILGVGVLCTIVGTIFVNALGRYALNANIIWAEELVLLLVPWLAMIGVFLAIRRGTMIRIEFFFDKLPTSVRRPLAPLVPLFCCAVLIFMGSISTRYVSLFGADRTPYLDVPKGLSSVALVIGAFAGALAFLVAAYRERRKGGIPR